MPTVDVRAADGSVAGTIELDAALFGVQPNVPLMHQVVTAQLAAARRGTQSTLTRAEVSGGGAKPYRQKGTGRARQGSTRAPHWQGGGVALGPKPRSYAQRTPKKMIRGALASALSDRASDGKVAVVAAWPFNAPKTKEARELLETLELEGRVLVVVDPDDELTIKSFRNLPEVKLLLSTELNAYDVLCSDWVVFSQDTLPGERVERVPVAVTKAKPAPKAAKAAKASEGAEAGEAEAPEAAGDAVDEVDEVADAAGGDDAGDEEADE